MNNQLVVGALQETANATAVGQGLGLARFMALRGLRVVESLGVLWHSVGHGLYMSLPYHRRLDLDPRAVSETLAAMGAIGVRYPSLSIGGLTSGLYVCRRQGYEIGNLHRNFRSHVKHGLPFCEVRRLSERELVEDARQINLKGMRRQRRYDPEFGQVRRWRRFAEAVQQSPCVVPMGAFVDGQLASYAITCLEDNWLHILYKMTDLQLDARHPSQVLDFTITSRALAIPGLMAVSMGWSPLVPIAGLHEYKIRLGYDCEPQYSVIQLRTGLERVLNSWLGQMTMHGLRRTAGLSQTLRTALAVADGVRLTCESARCTPDESVSVL
jgi:hypothetical protein